MVEQIAVDLSAERADVTVKTDLAAFGQLFVDRVEHFLSRLPRDQEQRLFMHGAFNVLFAFVAAGASVMHAPHVGVGTTGFAAAVRLKTFLQQARDR